MTTQQSPSHLERITLPKSQNSEINGKALALMLLIGTGCSSPTDKDRNAEVLKDAQKHTEQATKKSIAKVLQEVDSRSQPLSIMPHPSDKDLRTTLASLNIPIGAAVHLTDPYGEKPDKYYISASIPSMGMGSDIKIDRNNGSWVETLLNSNTKNKTEISDQKTYLNAVTNLRKQLANSSGKSSVKITDGKINATIIIPDAVAYAIKNNANKVSRDEIADILKALSFKATVVSVSEKTTTNKTSNTSGGSKEKSSSETSALGIILGIAGGTSNSSGTRDTNHSGTTTQKSETTSEPNWVNRDYDVDLTRNNALFNFIVDSKNVAVDNKFNPEGHEKIKENLVALEETGNKLFTNTTATNYEAEADKIFDGISELPGGKNFNGIDRFRKYGDKIVMPSEYRSNSGVAFDKDGKVIFTQPAGMSDFNNNLLAYNGSISQQYITDIYKDFSQVEQDIKALETIALRNGKVPVVVGVSVPDQIIKAKDKSQLFDPTNEEHITQAMGSKDPFEISVNFGGKIEKIKLTPKEFANNLPEKVVGVLQLLATKEQKSMAR